MKIFLILSAAVPGYFAYAHSSLPLWVLSGGLLCLFIKNWIWDARICSSTKGYYDKAITDLLAFGSTNAQMRDIPDAGWFEIFIYAVGRLAIIVGAIWFLVTLFWR